MSATAAFFVGVLVGGLLVFVACAVWAYEAMHPHDELSELERYAAQIEDRLEIDPRHPYDGIYCRDETIRLQAAEIDGLRAELVRRGSE